MKIDIREAKKIQEANGMFCRECGETDPKDGFYPMRSQAYDYQGKPLHASSLLCNGCDKKLRKPTKKNNSTPRKLIA